MLFDHVEAKESLHMQSHSFSETAKMPVLGQRNQDMLKTMVKPHSFQTD
jgi:hypothetical protein